MDSKVILLVVGICCMVWQGLEAANRHKLVVYWGQNAVYNAKKERQYWEKDLTHFCQNSKYDVVVLAFMHVFFDARQKDSLPALNFAYHCEKSIHPDYPFLLRCPKIEAGIKECQRNGKQVLISLGGATGGYGFQSDSQAKTFAHTVWNLLLGGKKMQNLRPFGSAILNGVDLDIEGGTHIGYTAFVKELRVLTKTDTSKYIIAAAPQCPYPDHFLGPNPGKAFGDVPELFDEIYVQFYNNYCQTGDAAQFYPNLKKWLTFSQSRNGPLIYVGVPSDDRAAFGRGYYRTPAEMAVIYQKIRHEPRFGGFMFWDASFDQNNIIGGKSYSEHIVALFGNGPRPTGNPVTLPPQKSTAKPVKTTTKSIGPTKPGKVSCSGLNDGMYAHPKDCAKFFECNSGLATVKSCPPGLKFNAAKKYCDWPANVTC